jgi:hypothetical protein
MSAIPLGECQQRRIGQLAGVQPFTECKAALPACQVERQRRLDDGSRRLEHRGGDSHAPIRHHELVALGDRFFHLGRGIVHTDQVFAARDPRRYSGKLHQLAPLKLCVSILRILPYDQINFDRAIQMHEIEHALRLDRRGGSFGPKDHPTTKEQADYNLKYLIAVALLDDQVGPAQLDETRVNAADTQALLAKVNVEPNPRFTEGYPDHLGCRIVIRTRSGSTYTRDQNGYEGGQDQPLTWERVVKKFHWLAEPYADASLRQAIIAEVEILDQRPISVLMSLLARVNPAAMFPSTLRGLQ